MPFRKFKITALMSGILLTGAILTSASAFAQPISEYEEVHPIYHDKRSGETFYQLYDRGEANGFSIIYSDRQGQWSKLSNISLMRYPYLFFKPYTNSFVYFASENPLLYNKQFMYDPSRKTVIDGQHYTMSPDGESGYALIEHYVAVRNSESGFTPRRGTTLLLKNMKSGVIRELWSGAGFLQTSYTNNGQLLVSASNKVYLAEPDTSKLRPIADGYLYYYADTTDEAIIVQPDSPDLLLYRTSDGSSRQIGPNDPRPNTKNMNTGFPPKSWPVPSPTLEVDSLPVTTLTAEYQPEALLTLGGEEYSGGMWKVSAPLAFTGTDQTVYVPVAPFVERLGLQVRKEMTSRSDSSAYRFKLSLQKHQLTLDDTNSRVVNYRLYVPLNALKQLGMGDVSIDWNAPAIPIPLESSDSE